MTPFSVLRGGEESKEQIRHLFKNIEKLPHPVSYSYFNFNIDLNYENRSEEDIPTTLDQLLEQQLSKRMKKFVPSNYDLVDYDRELLKK